VVVVDGWRERESAHEYHINFGWDDFHTAWYVVDDVYRSDPEEEREVVIVGIQPERLPQVGICAYSVLDAKGDSDGMPEPGEEVGLRPKVINRGAAGHGVSLQLMSHDPWIEVVGASRIRMTALSSGEVSDTDTSFFLSIDPACSSGLHDLQLITTSSQGTFEIVPFCLHIPGDSLNLEAFNEHAGGWSQFTTTPGFSGAWYLDSTEGRADLVSWKVGPPGENYGDRTDVMLTTAPLILPQRAELSFWHRINAELDSTGTVAWDGGVVMISESDCQWRMLEPRGGYSYLIKEDSRCPLGGGCPCFSGQSDWVREEFDLSEYSGVVRLAFRFASDLYVTDTGWYIDDMVVTSGAHGTDIAPCDSMAQGQASVGSLSLAVNCFPNPFNSAASIRYTLPGLSRVRLSVYNVLGQVVETLVTGTLPGGHHRVEWYPDRHASGVLFLRLEAGDAIATKKIIYLK
jgi:hypothetical protein